MPLQHGVDTQDKERGEEMKDHRTANTSTKKSLNAAFASVAGDASSEPTLESIDDLFLTFDSKSNRDSTESVVVALDKPLSTSSENFTPSNCTFNDSCNISGDQCRTSDINSLRIGSVEVEMEHHLE
ncbi:hypothetical protein Ancab_030058 [Ancistrocladus abbreviatus]